MKKIDIKFIATSSIIAALYVGLTWLLSPISYGAIQFRISEVLILLVVLNPKYAYSLVIGCLVANIASPLGWYDIVFGALATLFAVIPMLKIKNIAIACLFPVISNSIIISLELGIALDMFNIFLFNVVTIGLGEAVVLYCIGIPFCNVVLKNTVLKEILEIDYEDSDNRKSLVSYLYFIIGALGVIFYIAYPLLSRSYVENNEAIEQAYSALNLTKEENWLIIFLIISILVIIVGFIKHRYFKVVLNVILLLGLLVSYIFFGIIFREALVYPYYYGYSIYLIIYGLAIINATRLEWR